MPLKTPPLRVSAADEEAGGNVLVPQSRVSRFLFRTRAVEEAGEALRVLVGALVGFVDGVVEGVFTGAFVGRGDAAKDVGRADPGVDRVGFGGGGGHDAADRDGAEEGRDGEAGGVGLDGLHDFFGLGAFAEKTGGGKDYAGLLGRLSSYGGTQNGPALSNRPVGAGKGSCFGISWDQRCGESP